MIGVAPALSAVTTPQDVAAQKESAMRAFKRLGGTSTSLPAQFNALGRRFFEGELSLVAWPSEPQNNVWSYDTYAGLSPTPVPTAIYGDVMAMKMARTALSFDNGSRQGLALWVAADLRRENDLPSGATDPFDARRSFGVGSTEGGSRPSRCIYCF